MKPCAPQRGRLDRTMSAKPLTKNLPPDGLPAYRLLTGPDDAAFCHRVSEAVALGYQLYGSPAITFNGREIIVAQAIIWPSIQESIAERMLFLSFSVPRR